MLLLLLACTPPKIELDSGLDRDLSELDDTGSGDAGGDGGDDSSGDGGDDSSGDGGSGDAGGDGGDDTSGDGGDDTSGDGGGDTGDTGDTGKEDPPDPEPDYSVWYGTRTFTVEGCTESVEEVGYLLDESWKYYDDYYDDAIAACPDCTHFYSVEVTPSSVCGLDITTEIYRGLALDEHYANVYSIETFYGWGVWAESLEENADFDGWNISYDYETSTWDWGSFSYITIGVDGLVEFPALQ